MINASRITHSEYSSASVYPIDKQHNGCYNLCLYYMKGYFLILIFQKNKFRTDIFKREVKVEVISKIFLFILFRFYTNLYRM